MSHAWRVVVLLIVTAVALSGLLRGGPDGDVAGGSTAAPDVGACRVLTPDDVAHPSNATPPEACSQPHTAQTYAVGSLPARFADASYDDADVGGVRLSHLHPAVHGLHRRRREPGDAHHPQLGVVPAQPPRRGSDGARWYRCDVVGGGDQSTAATSTCPAHAQGLLLGRPKDAWLVCAQGATVDGSVKVPCTREARLAGRHHDRARRRLGRSYPGDRAGAGAHQDFCSKSVGAWLDYPVDYDFGYSWFHEAEWNAGNRRSVCWARTDS